MIEEYFFCKVTMNRNTKAYFGLLKNLWFPISILICTRMRTTNLTMSLPLLLVQPLTYFLIA